MSLGDVTKVQEMIASHPEFLAIKTTVNERICYRTIKAEEIRPYQVLVTFYIPRDGVDTVIFYREFRLALNRESTAVTQRERGN